MIYILICFVLLYISPSQSQGAPGSRRPSLSSGGEGGGSQFNSPLRRSGGHRSRSPSPAEVITVTAVPLTTVPFSYIHRSAGSLPTRYSNPTAGDNRAFSPTTPTARGRPHSLQTRGTPPTSTLTAARRPQSVTSGSRSRSGSPNLP